MIVPYELSSITNTILAEYRRIIEQELNFLVKGGKLKIEESGLCLIQYADKDRIGFSGTVKLIIEPNDALVKENEKLRQQIESMRELLDPNLNAYGEKY